MNLSELVGIVVYLLIAGGVCWLLWWLIAYLGVPEPFNKILRAIVAVIAVLICINLLLGLSGGTPYIRLR